MKADLETLRNTKEFAAEALVVEAQSLLATVMHDKDFTRAQLAVAMGVSRARVSQLFSADAKNFTLRFLARALHAMGERAVLDYEGHRAERHRQATVNMLKAGASSDLSWEPMLAANDRGGRSKQRGDVEVASGTLDSANIHALSTHPSLSKIRVAA